VQQHRIHVESKNDHTDVSRRVVTIHNVIFLASGNIERHTSMGLFPSNIYHQVLGYLTNYPIGYPGNKLPGHGSPGRGWAHMANWDYTGRVFQTAPTNRCTADNISNRRHHRKERDASTQCGLGILDGQTGTTALPVLLTRYIPMLHWWSLFPRPAWKLSEWLSLSFFWRLTLMSTCQYLHVCLHQLYICWGRSASCLPLTL